ncbi:MAG: division/cell wall cluster transcriptional repressor MraZ [Solirubrobacteraceae bacterium]
MPFHGIHDHTLDSKNRLTVPSKARALLAGGVTLAIGMEPCLQVWPADAHAKLVEQALTGLNPFSTEARELKRFFHANAETMELDSAGRITVAPKYAAHASIDKGVTVIGAGDCLELWDAEAWNAHNADLGTRAADHIANVAHPA